MQHFDQFRQYLGSVSRPDQRVITLGEVMIGSTVTIAYIARHSGIATEAVTVTGTCEIDGKLGVTTTRGPDGHIEGEFIGEMPCLA